MTRPVAVCHRKFVIAFLLVVVVVLVLLWGYEVCIVLTLPSFHSKNVCTTCKEHESKHVKTENKRLRILFFTTYINASNVKEKGCDVRQTNMLKQKKLANKIDNKKRYMMKREFLLRSIESYGVVIFHVKDMPGPRMLHEVSYWRPHGQLWAYYNKESPYNTVNLIGGKYDDVFNLTITPLRDSDVFAPYGFYERKNRSKKEQWVKTFPDNILFTNFYQGRDELKTRLIQQRALLNLNILFEHRQYLVAWVVSNCGHRRDNYVAYLMKHMPIDIFGRCSLHFRQKRECEKNNYKCELELRKYKFVIAFENSFCEDYITEKYWNALLRGNVPIVLGGNSYDSKVVVPNSFIDARSYRNAKSLAEHIIFLASHEDEYMRYLRWRDIYTIDYKPNDVHRLDYVVKGIQRVAHEIITSSYKLSLFYGRQKNCPLELNITFWGASNK